MAPGEAPAGRTGDALAWVLMSVFVTGALTLSLMPVVASELRQRFALSASEIGLLTSAFLFAWGAAGIPAGLAVARWGGRVLVASCLLMAAGSLVFALSSSFGLFALGRALQGFGGGMIVTACSPVLVASFPRMRLGRAWGIFGSGWGIGFMAALLIMPLLQEAAGFRAVFGCTTAVAFLAGVAVLTQRPVRARLLRAGAEPARALIEPLAVVLRNARVHLLAVFNGVGLAISVSALVWTPLFLQSHYSTSNSVSAYLTAGLGAAQVIATPLGALAARRWGELPVIQGCFVAMTLLIVLVPLVPGIAAVVLLVTAIGFFSMAFFSPLLALVPQVIARSEQIGPATGITALGFVGSLVAPWLFGALLDSGTGYVSAYLMLTAFGIAGLIGTLLFRRPARSTVRTEAGER